MATNETPADNDAVEAKALGVKKSKVSLASYKTKGPADTAREATRQEEMAAARVKNRIAKAKADAKKKPIDKRRELIQARFKAIRSRHRPTTYSDALIRTWMKELEVIQSNPKHWVKETGDGKKAYPIVNKKNRSARSLLDSMDLD